MNHVSRVRRVPLGNDPIRIGKAIGYGYLPIAVSKHGQVIGFYLPVERDSEQAKRAIENLGRCLDNHLPSTATHFQALK